MTRKVPIPRLQIARRERDGRRTSHACDSCRERKAKCDGGRPHCTQCLSRGLSCDYSERKFKRLQMELDSERRKLRFYERFIEDLAAKFGGPLSDMIREGFPAFAQTNAHVRPSKNLLATIAPLASHSKDGKTSSSIPTSSTAMPFWNVDVTGSRRNGESRAASCMKTSTSISLKQQASAKARRPNSEKFTAHEYQLETSSDDSISFLKSPLESCDLNNPIWSDCFTLPPKSLSDTLFEIYLDKVQVSLPFLRKDLFCAQYRRCLLDRVNPGRKWLAILNLVLAIGSAYSRLSGEVIPGAEENLFFRRAKRLSVSRNALYEHDDLQQVQLESLTAFFLLTVSQIDKLVFQSSKFPCQPNNYLRAWRIIGSAARSGISLGIHSRKKCDRLDIDAEEARKQLWWSIFRLEHLLSAMTGRVSCVGSASTSLDPPLPLPNVSHDGFGENLESEERHLQVESLHWTVDEDPWSGRLDSRLLESIGPTSSLYHFYVVDLSLIAVALTSEINIIDHRTERERIDSRKLLYNKWMDHWASSLVDDFVFEDDLGSLIPTIGSNFQTSLALLYYSTRIYLNRPCRCSPFEGNARPWLTFSTINDFSARTRLQAALNIMGLLPDQASLDWSYQLLQWWDLVHAVTQATMILLFQGVNERYSQMESRASLERIGDALSGAKKGISWLHCLGSTSASAQRTFEFTNLCMQHLTAANDLSSSGIEAQAGWHHTSRSPQEWTPNPAGFSYSGPVNGVRMDISEPSCQCRQRDTRTISQTRVKRELDPETCLTASALYDCGVDTPNVFSQLDLRGIQDLLFSLISF